MATTAAWFGRAVLAIFDKQVDWLDDDIRVMLTTAAYVPDQDAHDFRDDVTNEATGTGYAAGGVALTGKTITYTAATNVTMLDANDVQWPSSTITARRAVIYNNTPATPATKPLLGFQSSDVDITSTGGNFDLAWHAAGIFTVTVAAPA